MRRRCINAWSSAGGAWRAARDAERCKARLAKGEVLLTRLATTKHKTVNAQKFASTAGRSLKRVKAHKYFTYHSTIDERGFIRAVKK